MDASPLRVLSESLASPPQTHRAEEMSHTNTHRRGNVTHTGVVDLYSAAVQGVRARDHSNHARCGYLLILVPSRSIISQADQPVK